MDHSSALTVVARIAVVLLIGGVIGLERTFHGRPARFRTHALVSVASALLMLVTVYQSDWMTSAPVDMIRTDPTQMAQGIMTGIGCLGAGVIFKEGLTVLGLTTAASIWVTAAIGILIGVGFYFPPVIGSVATLIVLGVVELLRRACRRNSMRTTSSNSSEKPRSRNKNSESLLATTASRLLTCRTG
jgi:putative Mg2+ transporter-C (MgtC) family protein